MEPVPLKEAVGFVWNHRYLRALVFFTTAVGTAFALAQAVTALLFLDQFSVKPAYFGFVTAGIGLGAVACRARTLPDALFLTAARTLAGRVRQNDLDEGALYPPLKEIRKISLAIATSVATRAYEMKLARRRRPKDLRRSIEAMMYEP